MSWTPGDVSGDETLTRLDHLYYTHINELRNAWDAKPALAGDLGGTAVSPVVLSKTALTVGTSNANYVVSSSFATAINNAITAANAAGGGQVYIKYGSYTLSSNLTPKSNVTILADPGTTITLASGVFVNHQNLSNVTYQGIKFVMTNTKAIRSSGHSNLKIIGCEFTGTSSTDGTIVLDGSLGVSSMSFSDTIIQDCYFHDILVGQSTIHVQPRNGHTSVGFYSIRNKFINTRGMAVFLNVFDYAYNTNILGSYAKDLIEASDASVGYGSAVLFQTRIATGGTQYAQGVNIDRNYYSVTGMAAGGRGQGFCLAYNYSDLQLTNNTAYGSWTSSNQVEGPFFAPGRTSEACRDTLMSGNTIVGFDSPIDHDSSRYLHATKNTIKNCGHGLILGYGTKEYSVIDGNTEIECGYGYASGYSAYAILGNSNKVGCRITNNTIYSTDSGILYGFLATGHAYDNSTVLVSGNSFSFPNSTITSLFGKEYVDSIAPLASRTFHNEIIDSTGVKLPFRTNVSATAATTNAATTTLATIPVPASTTILIDAFVVARRTGGAAGTAEDAAAYKLMACYKNVAGAATEVGESSIFTAEDQAGWNCTVTPSGSNALIQVTGAVNNNITWTINYRIETASV